MYFAPVYPNINREDHTIFGNKSGGPIGSGGFSIYRNPYASMVQGSSKQSAYTINTAFELEQKLDFLTKGLNFKALVSFKNWSKTTVNRSFSPYFYELQNPQEQEDGSYLYDYNSISKGRTALETSTSTTGDRLMNLQATLNYQRMFGDKHDVGAMLVYLQREYNLTITITIHCRNVIRDWPDVLPMLMTDAIWLNSISATMVVRTSKKEAVTDSSLHSLSAILSPTRNSSNH